METSDAEKSELKHAPRPIEPPEAYIIQNVTFTLQVDCWYVHIPVDSLHYRTSISVGRKSRLDSRQCDRDWRRHRDFLQQLQLDLVRCGQQQLQE